MPTITIEPATADRFADVQHAFAAGGDGASCQCQWWLVSNREFDATTRDQREEMLRTELTQGPPPALVAYVDGEPAGWVRIGPRTSQRRLQRTRAFAASPEPWEDPGVWAVTCFVIRREHRQQGLATRLLAAAVDDAKASGARVVEAYPTDTAVASPRANDLFRGVLSMYLAAGFREVARPKPAVAIVELDLTSRATP